MGLGWKVAAGALLFMSIVSGLSYWYYKDSQATIKTLTENNAKLELAVEINETTIKVMQEDAARQAETLTLINKDFQDIRAQNGILSDKLSEHNIGFLAEKKSGLIERIVNNATKKANRCFELLSGAELTEVEKNATSAKSFNSECPGLWSGTTTN
jgi:hypothetical protein